MHRHGGACRPIGVEELAVDLIVATEVIHVDQESTDLGHVGQRRAGGGEDVADVLDDGARLHADVQRGGAHGVDLGAGDAVVGQARAGAGNEQEVACALDVRVFAAGRGFAGDDGGADGGGGHGCLPWMRGDQSLMQTLVGSV